jgi:hypothetical protein
MEDNKIAYNGYVMNKKGASTIDYGTPEHLSLWNEDGIAEETYKVASKVYSNYNWWKNTNYHEEDFVQDAVMYMVNLYRKNYFPTDQDNIKGIIYRLLNGFFVRNMYKKVAREKRNMSLDNTIGDTEQSYIENVESTELTPEEEVALAYAIEEGQQILAEVADDLSPIEYKTRKHKYIGEEKSLGKLKLSDTSIAKLLTLGYKYHDILEIYNVNHSNIGASSEATYVYRKTKEVIDKIAAKLNTSYTESQMNSVKVYLEYLED